VPKFAYYRRQRLEQPGASQSFRSYILHPICDLSGNSNWNLQRLLSELQDPMSWWLDLFCLVKPLGSLLGSFVYRLILVTLSPYSFVSDSHFWLVIESVVWDSRSSWSRHWTQPHIETYRGSRLYTEADLLHKSLRIANFRKLYNTAFLIISKQTLNWPGLKNLLKSPRSNRHRNSPERSSYASPTALVR
jgi:hypothetical protein